MTNSASGAASRSKTSAKRFSGRPAGTSTSGAKRADPVVEKLLRMTPAQRTATTRFLAALDDREWKRLKRWVHKVALAGPFAIPVPKEKLKECEGRTQ